jgi:hypothetical protein
MDAQARQLEGAASAWHAERGKYNRISSGIAQQEAQQAAHARFNHWPQQQDAAIAQAVPELSGERAEEFQKACVATLRDAGLNDAQIVSAWNQPQLRSVAGQKLLAQAARQRLARESLERAKVTKPTPRLMRPGNGSRNSDAGERSLADLSAKLSATGKLKDAVALRAAKRRAAARSH